jgi:hypothetical protein
MAYEMSEYWQEAKYAGIDFGKEWEEMDKEKRFLWKENSDHLVGIYIRISQ